MKSLVVLLLFSATAIAADLHPIVEMDTGYLFGGSADGKWVKAEKAAKSMKGRTAFRLFGLTQEVGKATAGKPKPAKDEVCADMLTVSLSPEPKEGEIALSGPWNALPRKPQIADPTQQVYVDAVRDFLKERRISDPKVKITRILRVDLDGDGEEEVLINATNYFTEDGGVPMDTAAPGSYSCVFLRRVVAGKVQTELIAGEFYVKNESNASNLFEISGVLDLNGDGKLEVIVHSHYYEGAETTIYDCSGGKCKTALSVGCGL
nr:FG-GAP repeat [uncultured bacterium]